MQFAGTMPSPPAYCTGTFHAASRSTEFFLSLPILQILKFLKSLPMRSVFVAPQLGVN